METDTLAMIRPRALGADGLRHDRRLALLAACASLAACATTTTRIDGSGVPATGLYSGEPVALHATEIPVTSGAEARARAGAALAARDIDLALYFFVQAVMLEPDDAGSLFAVGSIHEERGNAELAARAYERVTLLDPEHALAQQGLGLAYFEAREFAAARMPLERAVELDASLWRAQNTLGILADRDEDYEGAIAYYSAAIAAQPMLASVRNNRGYSHYLAGDLAAAEIDFLAALQIDAEYERAWRNLGLLLAREHDYERALEAMRHAVEEHVALNDIGYVAMRSGDYELAARYFERAIRISPRHYQTAQDNLAEVGRLRSTSPVLVATD